MSNVITNRIEFMFLISASMCNPNGDPDAGNLPRSDAETGQGIITNGSMKRKIRNYVEMIRDEEPGFRIHVKKAVPLNRNCYEAFDAFGVDPKRKASELRKDDPDIDVKLRDFMCNEFYDIRTFGAVLTPFTSAKLYCGQVTGPVQLCDAVSVDPVMPTEMTIIRVAPNKEDDEKTNEMGKKHIIPYGLYVCKGFISANFAQKETGFTEEDLELLWESILNMYEHDHSAARGDISVRKLIIFTHDNHIGSAPAHKLFDLVKIERADPSDPAPARKFSDYVVTVDTDNLPKGVTCEIRE